MILKLYDPALYVTHHTPQKHEQTWKNLPWCLFIGPISLQEQRNVSFPLSLSVGLAFGFCCLSCYFTVSQLQGCLCFGFSFSNVSAEAAVTVASHLVHFSSLLVGTLMAQSSGIQVALLQEATAVSVWSGKSFYESCAGSLPNVMAVQTWHSVYVLLHQSVYLQVMLCACTVPYMENDSGPVWLKAVWLSPSS